MYGGEIGFRSWDLQVQGMMELCFFFFFSLLHSGYSFSTDYCKSL